MNTSPVEGYTFTYCESIQSIKVITTSGSCNNKIISYCGNLVTQNLIIVYADSKKNGRLTTKSTYPKSKLAVSK